MLIGADGPYRGKLLTDGLERYDDIAAAFELEHFGCLQHCRRYYYKARKVSQSPARRSLAGVAIETSQLTQLCVASSFDPGGSPDFPMNEVNQLGGVG